MAFNAKELFGAIDGMDVEKFVSFLAEDAEFRFGNAPAVKGKVAIREAVAGFFSTIQGLRHRILNVWEQGSHAIVQGEVAYTRKDNSTITLPFANVFFMERGGIGQYLIYIDISPLFSPEAGQ